jgi:hypothetical protein
VQGEAERREEVEKTMGEYFNWVNVDRRERICPGDFDQGNKYHESMNAGNTCLKALRTLLSAEWKGCHVLFLGDEGKKPEKASSGVLASLREQTEQYDPKGCCFDMVFETYRNVSGLFREAEPAVRREIDGYLAGCRQDPNYDLTNEYGIDVEKPFEGLFLKNARDFHYTINETKREYYAIGVTKVYGSTGGELPDVDPLPMLMGYGRIAEPALWLGDLIRVTDEIGPGYTLLQEICLQSL